MRDPGLILPWMDVSVLSFSPLDVSLSYIAPLRGMLSPQLRVPPYPDMRLFLPMAGGVQAYSQRYSLESYLRAIWPGMVSLRARSLEHRDHIFIDSLTSAQVSIPRRLWSDSPTVS